MPGVVCWESMVEQERPSAGRRALGAPIFRPSSNRSPGKHPGQLVYRRFYSSYDLGSARGRPPAAALLPGLLHRSHVSGASSSGSDKVIRLETLVDHCRPSTGTATSSVPVTSSRPTPENSSLDRGTVVAATRRRSVDRVHAGGLACSCLTCSRHHEVGGTKHGERIRPARARGFRDHRSENRRRWRASSTGLPPGHDITFSCFTLDRGQAASRRWRILHISAGTWIGPVAWSGPVTRPAGIPRRRETGP